MLRADNNRRVHSNLRIQLDQSPITLETEGWRREKKVIVLMGKENGRMERHRGEELWSKRDGK